MNTGVNTQVSYILCCECGRKIDASLGNTKCISCLRSHIDITDVIPKDVTLNFCRFCERYLSPPSHWVTCSLESRELMTLCLKRIRNLSTLRLIDASYVWTEPHSKRIKIKLTVQSEVQTDLVMQQSCVVEFTVNHQMCDECRRVEANDTWTAMVQVRQKGGHVKTLLYLEQLILKFNMSKMASGIKAISSGMDFTFGTTAQAKKLVEFIECLLATRVSTSKKLIAHDASSNIYNYKYTWLVEIAPIAKDTVVCLSRNVARSHSNTNPICVVYKFNTVVHVIDPQTCQICEINGTTLFKHKLCSLDLGRRFKHTQYTVMNVELVDKETQKRLAPHAVLSKRHILADVWVTKSDELGKDGGDSLIHCKSHLGHLLQPGDTVLGIDMQHCNVNDANLNDLKISQIPDVILMKKVYISSDGLCSRNKRRQNRNWSLKHIVDPEQMMVTPSTKDNNNVNSCYDEFLEDLEEDVEFRQNVNIYKKSNNKKGDDNFIPPVESERDEEFPQISLTEMLEDLTIIENMGDDDDTNENTE